MNRDDVWQAIDDERLSLANLFGATRVWSMGRPFHAERKLSGFSLVGSDHPWSAGQGRQVEGPIAAILLLLTGRPAALSQLSGPGVAELQTRLSPQPSLI